MLHTLPAGFAEQLEGLLEALAGNYLAVDPVTRFLIGSVIERSNHFATEFCILFENRLNCFRRRIFTTWQCGDIGQPGQFVDHEQHILQWCDVAHL